MELPTFRDGDLLLRAKRPTDVDAVTEACQDPDIQRWTFVPSPYSRADAEAFLARGASEQAAGTAAHWVAVDRRDVLLGSFSLMEIGREPGYGEIGYWVTAAARGRGVATRSVRLITDWALGELALTTLEILPHEDNMASRRVAEKAGYLDTGALRGAPRAGVEEAVYAVYRWPTT